MTDFKYKLQAALKELEVASVGPYPKVPKFYSWLWKLGVPIKPAPYENLWVNTIMLGVLWGMPFAISFYIIHFLLSGIAGVQTITTDWPAFIAVCAVAGVLFGFAMAILARHDHKKHNLTEWDQLA